jgi:hypothetical protein
MSETETAMQLLKTIYKRLDPAKPVEPDSDFYQPIYGKDGREDPVARMRTHIQLNEIQSLQLFSGFRGSGKTTELFRLRRDLRQEGSLVIYASALDYLNPSDPVEISDLLMVFAGAFGDQLEQEFKISLGSESFWNRFTNYLKKTSLQVTEATAKVEADGPAKEVLGGLAGGLELKFAIKEASSFRKKLREFLQNRLPELKRQVDAFFEQGVKALRDKCGDRRIVFIFDQMEQLRGSLNNEREVMQSVERIFASHLDKLRLPFIHVICTVPPWLQFLLPGGTAIEILPSLQLWKKDVERSRCEAGWKVVRELVWRRLEDQGLNLIFGPEVQGRRILVDDLIAESGGHFRDLLRLFQEVIVRILTEKAGLPVPDKIVTGAIRRTREQYLPITEQDAAKLEEIQLSHASGLGSNSSDEIGRITRLLDLHLMLYFSNGEEWYDTHPLVRDEVEAVMRRVRSRSQAS